MIRINVGGTDFWTTKTTLENQKSSFFKSLVSYPFCDDATTGITIDRDPTHFRHVLNFLRNSPSFPDDTNHLHELYNEADYYCLDDLKALLNKQIELQQFSKNQEVSNQDRMTAQIVAHMATMAQQLQFISARLS